MNSERPERGKQRLCLFTVHLALIDMILPSLREHEFPEREAESQHRSYMKVVKTKAAEKYLY